ncbi:MAG: PepSY domain-containing protein [Lachnospiraceae bacterium]|nr:PepSY domain-containing protein [Lachnospiraceae bacterium]
MTNNIQNTLKVTGRRILSITCMALLLTSAPAGIALAESNTVIGEKSAQNNAFADAGIAQADAEFLFTELDQEDGQAVYEIDFTVDGTEYEYNIDAYDGSVLKKSVEYVSLHNTLLAAADTGSTVTSDEAKEIALEHTGLSEEELALVVFTRETTDYDDGLVVYDLDFSTEDLSYEYEISEDTGDILSFSWEVLPTAGLGTVKENTANSASTDTVISLDEAKVIALEKAGLSEADVTFKKTKLDKGDGTMVYEIEFSQGRMEYKCEINASTGKIIEYNAELDD